MMPSSHQMTPSCDWPTSGTRITGTLPYLVLKLPYAINLCLYQIIVSSNTTILHYLILFARHYNPEADDRS
jgi:hypothetical protein